MKASVIFLFSLLSFVSFGQTTIKGVVKDATTNETIIGASVTYMEGKGTVTDFDGNFELQIPNGSYTLKFNYTGYQERQMTLKAVGKTIVLDISLQNKDLDELIITGDIAVDRSTPVAFTDIPSIKIKEELAGRDLPMLLNTTPGVYATQTGGGDGDARINIRGFNQRYIAVMIDGIPMNDMENGWVYWSNWFGLDNVIQKTQVQRGLGATKLSVPSIGGSMNIITSGIESKTKLTFASELGNNRTLRETVGYNSGRLKGGWGVTAALSVRRSDGWVEQLSARQLFYYLKVQKELGKHLITASVMGSPQEHNQRQQRQFITYYDRAYAAKVGMDTADFNGANYGNFGVRHNQFWGTLRRTRYDANAPEETLPSLFNYYHKPIASLKHFWNINDKMAWSNIAYASFGRGGGTQLQNTILDANGQIDFNQIYYNNTHGSIFVPAYDLAYVNDTSQYKARNFIYSLRNDHFWAGVLSTFKYKPGSAWEFSGGLDGRYYMTHRYKQVYDLLGGDYLTSGTLGNGLNKNDPNKVVFRDGETFDYEIYSYVRQIGLFGLAEYKADVWSAFLNVSASIQSYNRKDMFALKNPDGTYQTSGWITLPGGTIKGGLNYNISPKSNIFCNFGYLSRAQLLFNVFNSISLNTYSNTKNEEIIGNELGYTFNNKNAKLSVNGYYTIWNNKPVRQTIQSGTETYNVSIPGMNAHHRGIEFEGDYKFANKLTLNGVVSLGNWQWVSNSEAIVTDITGATIIDTVRFSAKGVKVGDAAQTQFSFGVRYAPVKGLYISPRITYFDNYFADFDPETLQRANANRQSWKIPSYYTVDVNAGYFFPIGQKKYEMGVRLNLLNITNVMFISDARNNDFGNTFDANSAGVYMGLGFRWNVGVSFTF
jgi:iron complex outermembrane receptor protein